MPDNPTDNPRSGTSSGDDLRLRKCRVYRHGLSKPPVVKKVEPRGEKSLLPCPKGDQGRCVYRRYYRCTDEIQAIGQNVGCCVIESAHYEKLAVDLHRVLEYRDDESPGPEVIAAVRACVEAMIYQLRCMAYIALVQTKEVEDPAARHLLDYQGLALSAYLRRREDVIAARMRELHLDVEMVRRMYGDVLWTWWRESRRDPSMRRMVSPRGTPAA